MAIGPDGNSVPSNVAPLADTPAPAQPDIYDAFKFNLATQSPIDPAAVGLQNYVQKMEAPMVDPAYVTSGQMGGPVDVENTTRALQTNLQMQPPPAPPEVSEANINEFAVAPAAEEGLQKTIDVPQVNLQDVINKQLKTYNQEQQAVKAIADAGIEQARAQQELMKNQEQQIAKQQLESQQRLQNFENNWKEKQAYLDNVAKELSTQSFESGKIDSGRLFRNMNTAGKISVGIGLALGGFAAGNGPNVALEIINKAIDRDIAEQRFNIENRQEAQKMKAQNLRDQVSAGNTIMDNLRQQFNSVETAETAMRLLSTQQAEMKLKQLAGRYNEKTIPQSAKITMAALERQKQDLSTKLKMQMAQQQLLKSLATADLANVSEGQLLAAGMDPKVAEAYAKQAKDVRERSMPPNSGWKGTAQTKENQERFTKVVSESMPAVNSMKELIAFGKNANALNPKDRALMGSKLAQAAGALRVQILGPGIMTEQEYDRLLSSLGNPTAIISLGKSVEMMKLQQTLKKMENDIAQQAATYGFYKDNAKDNERLQLMQKMTPRK